jgi:hypothetical protein
MFPALSLDSAGRGATKTMLGCRSLCVVVALLHFTLPHMRSCSELNGEAAIVFDTARM